MHNFDVTKLKVVLTRCENECIYEYSVTYDNSDLIIETKPSIFNFSTRPDYEHLVFIKPEEDDIITEETAMLLNDFKSCIVNNKKILFPEICFDGSKPLQVHDMFKSTSIIPIYRSSDNWSENDMFRHFDVGGHDNYIIASVHIKDNRTKIYEHQQDGTMMYHIETGQEVKLCMKPNTQMQLKLKLGRIVLNINQNQYGCDINPHLMEINYGEKTTNIYNQSVRCAVVNKMHKLVDDFEEIIIPLVVPYHKNKLYKSAVIKMMEYNESLGKKILNSEECEITRDEIDKTFLSFAKVYMMNAKMLFGLITTDEELNSFYQIFRILTIIKINVNKHKK